MTCASVALLGDSLSADNIGGLTVIAELMMSCAKGIVINEEIVISRRVRTSVWVKSDVSANGPGR